MFNWLFFSTKLYLNTQSSDWTSYCFILIQIVFILRRGKSLFQINKEYVVLGQHRKANYFYTKQSGNITFTVFVLVKKYEITKNSNKWISIMILKPADKWRRESLWDRFAPSECEKTAHACLSAGVCAEVYTERRAQHKRELVICRFMKIKLFQSYLNQQRDEIHSWFYSFILWLIGFAPKNKSEKHDVCEKNIFCIS